MTDVLKGLGIALVGTVVLCLIAVFVYSTVKFVQSKKTSVELADNVKIYDNPEEYFREIIAQDFDRMASQLNPDDRERSALYSRWATNAADRIRHPERYSGMAKGTRSE